MSNIDRLFKNNGFTMVEVIVASMIISFAALGIWGVYWSVVNTYYVEQKGVKLETEGERILDLIANGGYFKGKRIYGLNSSIPYTSGSTNYPRVGKRETDGSSNFIDMGDDCPHVTGCDYRIEFCLDNIGTNRRFAEFVVKFTRNHPPGEDCVTYTCYRYASSELYFRVKTEGTSGEPYPYNYEVLITENMLYRTESEDFEDYDKTWFKAKLLPKDSSSDYHSGIKVSFYLVDITQPLKYNRRLERELTTPISDPDQRRSFMGGIPYPKYFSTTIYFPNRE